MPKRSVFLGVAVLLILLIGIWAIYSPQLPTWLGGQPALRAADEQTYVADLDFWQRTPRERFVEANAHFDLDHDLNRVPMTVGDWRGVDAPETNQEVMILLQPDQYVQRYYEDSQNRGLWLTMVGGRSSQPFHAPDICYDADGWQYDLGSEPTELSGGGDIYGLWLHATKKFEDSEQPAEHVVYYFYLFPDEGRDQSDGIVLFKVTSGRYGTVESTLQMQAEFVREFFRTAVTPVETAATAQ